MLSEILKTLYSPNGDICQVLNQSRLITEIKKKSDVVLLFNTGFRFFTHLGTPMDLYFDLLKQEVIRSTKSPLPIKPPQLIGFMGAILDSKYLDRVVDYFCIRIDSGETSSPDPEDLFKGLGLVHYRDLDEVLEKGSISPTIEILDGDGVEQLHSSFQIISESECIDLPLRKTLSRPIFFDGKTFSEYDPSFHDRILSREEWLAQEFGEEADTAYWNID